MKIRKAPNTAMSFSEPGAWTMAVHIALSLALGMLAGVQRGWTQRKEAAGSRFAGIRTFALLGLGGGVAGALQAHTPAIAAIVLAAIAALVLIGYLRSSQSGTAISGTASLAGLLTLASGFLASSGQPMFATAVAVVMVMVLAMRPQLHRFVGRMSEAEVIAAARFALIAMVILPLLPDAAFGPLDAWNPRQLWLVVVLVSGFSFAGYIATRLLGPSRGIMATAAAGSVVSSTAVTVSLATRLRDDAGQAAILAAGIAAASAVMFVRIMVLTRLLAPFALLTLARIAVPAMLVSAGAGLWAGTRARGSPRSAEQDMKVRNPFDFWPALLLMALVMVLTLAARWTLDHFGHGGMALVLALSGMVDTDSAIITMGNLPAGTLAPRIAGLVLVPPILLNTLIKAAAVLSIAGWRKGWRAAWPLFASTGAGLAGLVWALRT